jgi:type I site-specific restriction-modification system R (restriction) subunit
MNIQPDDSPSPTGRGARGEGERENFSDVVLLNRLENALTRINPDIPPYCRQQAIREILNITSSDLISNNEKFHQYLTEGITVEYQKQGDTRREQLWLIDWQNLDKTNFRGKKIIKVTYNCYYLSRIFLKKNIKRQLTR